MRANCLKLSYHIFVVGCTPLRWQDYKDKSGTSLRALVSKWDPQISLTSLLLETHHLRHDLGPTKSKLTFEHHSQGLCAREHLRHSTWFTACQFVFPILSNLCVRETTSQTRFSAKVPVLTTSSFCQTMSMSDWVFCSYIEKKICMFCGLAFSNFFYATQMPFILTNNFIICSLCLLLPVHIPEALC